jgi:hypothetical protein
VKSENLKTNKMEKQMKTQSSAVRSTIIKVVMVWMLIVNSFAAIQAQKTSTSPNAEIKYIGIVDDKLVFEVEYKNASEVPFILEIRDGNGFEFYTGKFKQKNFRKKYAIDKSEIGNTSISFVVASQGNVQQQDFDVNASSRLVEEVSVVKL